MHLNYFYANSSPKLSIQTSQIRFLENNQRLPMLVKERSIWEISFDIPKEHKNVFIYKQVT